MAIAGFARPILFEEDEHCIDWVQSRHVDISFVRARKVVEVTHTHTHTHTNKYDFFMP